MLDLEPVLDRCKDLQREGALGLGALRRVLEEAQVCEQTVALLSRPDPSRPYGRRVLFADAHMEAMIALWTPGIPCAPHDHGGSVGGVRVLQGEAIHRIWRVRGGRLEQVAEERVGAGGVLACGPELVHSMEDAGGALPLATLHLYAGPIDHMVVYDSASQRTLIVDGGCGAWVPDDEPHRIRAAHAGMLAPAELA